MPDADKKTELYATLVDTNDARKRNLWSVKIIYEQERANGAIWSVINATVIYLRIDVCWRGTSGLPTITATIHVTYAYSAYEKVEKKTTNEWIFLRKSSICKGISFLWPQRYKYNSMP